MSLLDNIVDLGKSVGKLFTASDSIFPSLAKTALIGFAVNQLNKNVNKENSLPESAQNNRTDTTTRVQQSPDTTYSIPVVYGTAFIGGIVTDAILTNNNKSMYFCITICEKTGKKINEENSKITFLDAYWRGNRIVFKPDGITIDYIVDDNGNADNSLSGLVKIWAYSGSSQSPTNFPGFNTNIQNAYSIFPNWTSLNMMNDLIFAIVKVDYNKEKQITGLEEITFKINNSMSEAGDVLFDYMTNTRYGAGIPIEEINV